MTISPQLPSRLGEYAQTISDWNDARKNGWYMGAIAANAPAPLPNWVIGEVIAHNDGYITQRVWDFTAPQSSPIYERRSWGGNWGQWALYIPLVPERLAAVNNVVHPDLNNAKENGWYMASATTANRPPVETGYVVQVLNTDYAGHVRQIAYRYDTDEIFMRRCTGDVWGSWTTWPIPPRLGETPLYVSDWNDTPASGWYRGSDVTLNSPVTGWQIGLVTVYSSLYITQDVWAFLDDKNYMPRQWHRQSNGPSVGPWIPSPLGGRLASISQISNDLNTAVENGWYQCKSGETANTPAGVPAAAGMWGICRTETLNAPENCVQTWYEHNSNQTYERRRWNGVWQPWRKLPTIDAAGNIVAPASFTTQTLIVAGGEIYGSNGKWFVNVDGSHQWGPGDWNRDTHLYRTAAGKLRLDGTLDAAALTVEGVPIPASPSYGISLPASPVNGQEAILVDSLSNPTYQWRFRYNAVSSSAYKWEFMGGAPAITEVNTEESHPHGSLCPSYYSRSQLYVAESG